jgi:hypothetical protein
VISLWLRDMDGLVKDLFLRSCWGRRRLKFIDDMRQRFEGIASKAMQKPTKRVSLQMWTDPLITVGRASFTDWLVRAAGAVNVFADMPFDSGQISVESLIQRNPEVLIFLAEQAPFVKTLARRPGWSSIRGVRDGHFCFIDEPDIRRSILFIDGLAKLHHCLSPTPQRATVAIGAQGESLYLSAHPVLVFCHRDRIEHWSVPISFLEMSRRTKKSCSTCVCRVSSPF